MEKKLYSVKEIAETLKVSKDHINQLFIRHGFEVKETRGFRKTKYYDKKAFEFARRYISAERSDKMIVRNKEYRTANGIAKILGITDDAVRSYTRANVICPKFKKYNRQWYEVKETVECIEKRRKNAASAGTLNVSRKPTKCWHCLKANDFGCDWFKKRKPVKGWKATHPLNGYGEQNKNSYIVESCPEFMERFYRENGKLKSRPLLPECDLGREARTEALKAFQSVLKLG